MELRTERPADRRAVTRVHLDAFGDDGRRLVALVNALRTATAPADGLSLVAHVAGEVVGHAMFSPGLLDAPRRLVAVQVLSPVAVLPERQRQGIGSALVRRGLEVMTERSVPIVFLEGNPHFYRRLGLTPGAQQGFRKPSLRIPDAAFQAIRLPACEPWMSGTLVYSDPFWRCDAVGLRDAGD